MSIHIIIDGYNLIRQSRKFRPIDHADIALGRDALIDSLVAYKRLKHHQITVVFDGAAAPDCGPRQDNIRGIRIRFSRAGELADAVIKRMAAREREKALIVSSDREIIDYAEGCHAASIDSMDFEERLEMADYLEAKGGQEEEHNGWRPTTKKKGPSRRLSRRKWRNRSKISKL
jgi:predicted RNA-binding protein with PIN domain